MLLFERIETMKKLRSSNIVALAILLIAGIVAMVPYFTANALHSGVDMSFHLNRIYDLSQNIKNGNYFSYIETYANNQVGSPINMVYGALPLYPFAIMLNIFSNKIIAIYLGYLVIVWISLMISYYVGLKYWQKDKKRAILFAVVYVLSTYNFSWMFGVFDLGQVSGYVFLPLIVYGTYSIFYRPSKEWWLLSIEPSLLNILNTASPNFKSAVGIPLDLVMNNLLLLYTLYKVLQ